MSLGESAPLVSIPGAVFPPQAEAFWYEGEGGLRLRAALIPAPQARGSVVINPGRTEPIEKYVEVVGELHARGYSVLVHDWRGQGLSPRLLDDPLRGHAQGFEAFIKDLRRLLALTRGRLPGPRLVIGHSMGGCLTMLALAKGLGDFQAALLSAPMLGLKLDGRPAWQGRLIAAAMRALGRGGGYVMGIRTDPLGFEFERYGLTHDRLRFERMMAQVRAEPGLALGHITWGWLASALAAMAWLERDPSVARIAIPVTAVAAAEDSLVLNTAIPRVISRLPNGRYVEIEGAGHELMIEVDPVRARFWEEFERLEGEVGGIPPSPPSPPTSF